ncbi:GNAT family N-acetyltransferase [Hoeflea prorocentri]|uniref:GNAT family protein n=1 Tax=Hoeflea prorocentri TaxID=1922333 RepID=A0A9X3UK73_9HYPH|nr:GNAT family protein [Hoeflea prorocentri]MCY6382847.1 GNAT family protein [Hoeflea prorocentri]MDA5400647.1 GNAT family protein [Hoeflea prorocentri]
MNDVTAQAMYSMRPMGADDISVMAEWFADFEDIALFDRSLPVPVGPQAVLESWKPALELTDPPTCLWYVAQCAQGKPTGIGGLQKINYIHGDAVLPIFVARHARENGLATAMTIELLDLAFQHLRLHRVTTLYRDDHETTALLTRNLGFQEEGRVREGWYANGRHYDVVQVGILNSEWSAKRVGARAEFNQKNKVRIKLEAIPT